MRWIVIASISGALAVAAGAFGAHGLRAELSPQLLDTWDTATRYHLLHSVVLLSLGLFSLSTQRRVGLPAGLFTLGILTFSGSLYGWVLLQRGVFVLLAPVGGGLLIGGWLALLWGVRAATAPSQRDPS